MSAHSGLLLRLAGPLSAYGTQAAFTHRDTNIHPTRSAVIGLLAAAAGRPRNQVLHPFSDLPGHPTYHDLTLTIRIDKPGTLHTDYHVTGGGYPRPMSLRTSTGNHRPPSGSALPSHRIYLADAAFTLALTGPPHLIDTIADQLEHPHYAPYLGRRACVPDEPLVLGKPLTDPVHHLLHHTPLTLPNPPRPDAETVPVTVVWEQPPTHTSAARPYELTDQPRDYTQETRQYSRRRPWHTTEHLPAHLYAGRHPQTALADYLEREPSCTKRA
ncbi:type I-E CRISPR-associated protein Cas5/CasD [Streptomyces sp. NBC_00887]|uniref:type I-E CRISPR-associated protein Cas5/CasD n=1 Tax=Streptomyces sp. NBC_00887 TaxID=2975859 RepID=UPI00386A3B97|nr:type I-E CRISPR-associated protein Cas5/CasD [Streptomyces sp. NBC_00887]WSY36189.1 type I-E CRISPR-associated protein Cas5/CasD [Streptomyces sp. NBC_00887]